MKNWVWVVMAVLTSSGGASGGASSVPTATTETTGELDKVVAEYVSSRGLPGLAVAVVKDGKLAYSQVAGVRKQGDPTPVERGDAFHIGSDTKAMTALLAAMLVDEGKLSWNDTIESRLKGVISFRPEYAGVTLEQLLCHETGIPSDLASKDWWTFFASKEPVREERKRMAEKALSLAPVSKPATAFLYSNFNYVVAGLMMEVITGKSWEDLLRERLFGPMGMKGAGFGPPASPGKVDAPWGHNPKPVVADNPPALGPAGTVHATLDDMVSYLHLYMDGGRAKDGSKLVSPESLAFIYKPRMEKYALGWLNLGSVETPVLVHDGSNTMFYCSIVVMSASRLGIIVMTNRGDATASALVIELREKLAARFSHP